MNLATGLLRPTRGSVRILGISPTTRGALRARGLLHAVDAFPAGMTGRQFVYSGLRLVGRDRASAREGAERSLAQLGLSEAADRPWRLQQGDAPAGQARPLDRHGPAILFLDEPLNGLDPMARAEVIALFRSLADAGLHVIVSSHVLHEVDLVSDRVLLMKGGTSSPRGRSRRPDRHHEQTMQVLVRCDRPGCSPRASSRGTGDGGADPRGRQRAPPSDA